MRVEPARKSINWLNNKVNGDYCEIAFSKPGFYIIEATFLYFRRINFWSSFDAYYSILYGGYDGSGGAKILGNTSTEARAFQLESSGPRDGNNSPVVNNLFNLAFIPVEVKMIDGRLKAQVLTGNDSNGGFRAFREFNRHPKQTQGIDILGDLRRCRHLVEIIRYRRYQGGMNYLNTVNSSDYSKLVGDLDKNIVFNTDDRVLTQMYVTSDVGNTFEAKILPSNGNMSNAKTISNDYAGLGCFAGHYIYLDWHGVVSRGDSAVYEPWIYTQSSGPYSTPEGSVKLRLLTRTFEEDGRGNYDDFIFTALSEVRLHRLADEYNPSYVPEGEIKTALGYMSYEYKLSKETKDNIDDSISVYVPYYDPRSIYTQETINTVAEFNAAKKKGGAGWKPPQSLVVRLRKIPKFNNSYHIEVNILEMAVHDNVLSYHIKEKRLINADNSNSDVWTTRWRPKNGTKMSNISTSREGFKTLDTKYANAWARPEQTWCLGSSQISVLELTLLCIYKTVKRLGIQKGSTHKFDLYAELRYSLHELIMPMKNNTRFASNVHDSITVSKLTPLRSMIEVEGKAYPLIGFFRPVITESLIGNNIHDHPALLPSYYGMKDYDAKSKYFTLNGENVIPKNITPSTASLSFVAPNKTTYEFDTQDLWLEYKSGWGSAQPYLNEMSDIKSRYRMNRYGIVTDDTSAPIDEFNHREYIYTPYPPQKADWVKVMSKLSRIAASSVVNNNDD